MDQRGSVLMRLDFVEIAQFLITRRSVSSGNSSIGHSGQSVIGLILRWLNYLEIIRAHIAD
jgi:hypothetical protein